MASASQGVASIALACLLTSCAAQRPFSAEAVARSIVRPSEWGGRPDPGHASLRRHEVRRLTLHHGGEDFPPDREVLRYLRNLQDWSRREKKWADIPYHFIIDLEGRVYAGRPLEFAGDTNTEYDPSGHALVCVLGNYDLASPTAKQLRAVEDVLAMLCWNHGLGPEAIAGHKDHSAQTACPGRNLYARLASGEIQAGVRRRLADLARTGAARTGLDGPQNFSPR